MRIVAITLCLLSTIALPALAGGDDHGGKEHKDHAERMTNRWDSMDPSKRDALMARAESHGMFARFAYDNATGLVAGRFLTFHLAAQTGAIHDVRTLDRTNATLWFDGITPSTFGLASAPRKTGAVLHVEGTNLSLMAHNNPTGGLHYQADANVTLTFALAAGATIGPNVTRELQVRANGIHGHILTNGDHPITVEGRNVLVRLAAGDSAMFRAHHATQDALLLHGENRAFKERLLGASVRMAGEGGECVVDDVASTVAVEPLLMQAGRAELNVSSDHAGAQVLFLTIDGATLSPRNARNLSVELSGEKAIVMPSVEGVLTAPGLAAYLQGDAAAGTVQVVLRVPHFSSYTLAIADLGIGSPDPSATNPPGSTTAPPAGTASGTQAGKGSPGLTLVGVLAALAAVALAMRRRA